VVLKKMLGASPCLNVIYKLHRESAGNPPLSDRIGQRCFRGVGVRGYGTIGLRTKSWPGSIVFLWETLATAKLRAAACSSCGSTGGRAIESITRSRAQLACCCVSACHPEAAESLAQPRTPSEGSVHSHGSVAQANCIDPSAHKERGPQDDSAGRAATGKGHYEMQSERIPRRSHNS